MPVVQKCGQKSSAKNRDCDCSPDVYIPTPCYIDFFLITYHSHTQEIGLCADTSQCAGRLPSCFFFLPKRNEIETALNGTQKAKQPKVKEPGAVQVKASLEQPNVSQSSPYVNRSELLCYYSRLSANTRPHKHTHTHTLAHTHVKFALDE